MQSAGSDIYGSILCFVDADSRQHLARSCRAWWRPLHRAWYAEHRRRHRWRHMLHSLPTQTEKEDWGEDNPYLDALPPRAAAALRALLDAEPALRAPGEERDLMPYLCCHFGRWALLQQWAAACAPGRLRRAGQGLRAALQSRPACFWDLAQYTDMNMMATVPEWWAFCRLWRPATAVCCSFGVDSEDWGDVEEACAAALDAETHALLGCLGCALGLDGI